MNQIINTTPHPITFRDTNGGEFTVSPCGVLINAKTIEEEVGEFTNLPAAGVKKVRARFVPEPASEEALVQIEHDNPDAVIVGSIIAAQAFPGRVFAMIAAPGFERVPVDQKRMRCDKFTTF